MSVAIPFARCPAPLADCPYAGNYGFDPLGLASSSELLAEYREAEIKHSRLAMLVRWGRRACPLLAAFFRTVRTKEKPLARSPAPSLLCAVSTQIA
jgi:hypothetical protein